MPTVPPSSATRSSIWSASTTMSRSRPASSGRVRRQIHFAGRVFDESEVVNLVDSSLEFWLTAGPLGEEVRAALRPRSTALRHALLVNSGSSANLVALSCLTSPKLGERRLRPGDEVITVRGRLPDHGQPDHPERPACRSSSTSTCRPTTSTSRMLEAALSDRTPGDHDRPHARQPVRPRRGHRLRREARPLADRGLLRRARLDLPTASRSAPSATSPRSASTRPTTSRWARAAAC